MKRHRRLSLSIFVLCIIISFCGSTADEDEEASSSSSPMMEIEKEALFTALQSFVGKWWNGSDLYPDPCGWTPIQGVSCDLYDGYWYVTDISLGPIHDNSLICDKNVEFTSHLFALRRLKSLSFFNCFVNHPVKIPIKEWEIMAESLESLEFRTNPALIGEIPPVFGMLKNLKSLVLTANGLTGEIPENLGYLTNLQRLNLAGNSFTGKIPATFGGMKQLLILDISRNSLSGELPPSLGEAISLLKLDLSNNQLTGTIPQQMGNLKNLTLLDLSNNRLSGGLSESIQEMISLQELSLANNPISGNIMNLQFQKLVALAAMDFSNISLTGEIPDSITELTSLRFFGLGNNNLIGEIPEKLASLPNISALYLQSNNLTGELKFPEQFYTKLGRRFGAWGNPNLCFPSQNTVPPPFGVKQCTQNIIKYEMKSSNTTHQSSNSDSVPWKDASCRRLVCHCIVLIITAAVMM